MSHKFPEKEKDELAVDPLSQDRDRFTYHFRLTFSNGFEI